VSRVGELALSRATGDLIAEVDALLEKGDDALPSERQALAARLGRSANSPGASPPSRTGRHA
jgi:hypothetical protein